MLVKLPALSFPKINSWYFSYTAVPFSISKEIKERYGLILLLGK